MLASFLQKNLQGTLGLGGAKQLAEKVLLRQKNGTSAAEAVPFQISQQRLLPQAVESIP
jgi:hypothetical protein